MSQRKRSEPSLSIKRRPKKTQKDHSGQFKLFATTDAGFEEILAKELKRLGARRIHTAERGAGFTGDLSMVYRANIHLRCAYRVLLELAEFDAPNREALYEGVRQVFWGEHMTLENTFAVDAVSNRSALSHTQFVSRVVKDAIVDGFNRRFGRRPNVDPAEPDIRINARILNDRCTLSLDTSGERLHRRGYRPSHGVAAPLKETLAAGILMTSGFKGDTPLYDPMCGSGTFLVEAALLAKRIAPGLLGRTHAFRRLPWFDRTLYKQIVTEAKEMVLHDVSCDIVGTDIDDNALRAVRAAASGAGVDDLIRVRKRDLKEFQPRSKGMVVTNPPYGERLGDIPHLEGLYRDLGDILKQRCTGMTAHILTASPFLAKQIGLRPHRRDILFNGPLECRLLHFRMY
jgi:putative N6-adenine-specific DNA methylase